jgi:cbb3-type cytochrome oxidase subunit 3
MVSNAGALKANSGEIFSLGVPDWLAPWMPPELISALPAMVSVLTPAVDSLLSFAPAMGGVLSVAVWVVWGIGSILLVVLGIVLSAVIALMLRRRSAKSGRAMATRSYG